VGDEKGRAVREEERVYRETAFAKAMTWGLGIVDG